MFSPSRSSYSPRSDWKATVWLTWCCCSSPPRRCPTSRPARPGRGEGSAGRTGPDRKVSLCLQWFSCLTVNIWSLLIMWLYWMWALRDSSRVEHSHSRHWISPLLEAFKWLSSVPLSHCKESTHHFTVCWCLEKCQKCQIILIFLWKRRRFTTEEVIWSCDCDGEKALYHLIWQHDGVTDWWWSTIKHLANI